MVMPWVVVECGRRGATGGVRGLLLSIVLGLTSRAEMAGDISGRRSRIARCYGRVDHSSSFRDGALAPDPESRDSGFIAARCSGMTASPHLVDHGVVWLGSAFPSRETDAFQLLPLHFR